LRLTDRIGNARNVRRKPGKHGFVGVHSRTKGSYHGTVSVRRKPHYTRTFPCPILAAAARDVLAQRLHGVFHVPNFTFHAVRKTQEALG
jgi:hypothetical protein